jgi:hypothetical protein
MVLERLVPGVLAALAGMFGVQPAWADVYVWTDASGRMNVSNLSPPDGAHVTRVIPSPPKSEAREEAAREAARRAEIQALNDRVARLSDQLEQSRREAAVPVAYPVPSPVAYPPPPVSQYATWAPPPVQYVVDTSPQTPIGCGYAWNDCGAAWGAWSWPYFTNVVVVRDKNFRHVRPGLGHGTRPMAPQPLAHAPWDPVRR